MEGRRVPLPENVLIIFGRPSIFLWRFRIFLARSEEMASGLTKVFISYLQTSWKSNLNSKYKILHFVNTHAKALALVPLRLSLLMGYVLLHKPSSSQLPITL